MRDHRPKSTNELLAASRLSQIQQHAVEISQLNSQIKPFLPKGCESLVRVANVRHGLLSIEVASAAIKMKLEYERLHLLSQLRQAGFASLVGLDIVINPSIYRVEKSNAGEKPNPRVVSTFAAEMLNMVASNASPKVKARLENIANLAKNNSDN